VEDAMPMHVAAAIQNNNQATTFMVVDTNNLF
jgi:hypothetical protein